MPDSPQTQKKIFDHLAKKIHLYQSDIVKDLSKLISIRTVNEGVKGDHVICHNKEKAFRFIQSLAKKMGLLVYPIPKRGMIVEWGQGQNIIDVPCHLDVVQAGRDWTVAPFRGTVKNSRVYGRGAVDNKGPCISALYALFVLKEAGLKPKKTIRLIYCCDEESGIWVDMAVCLKKLQRSKFAIVQDSHFPVVNAEKGFLDVIVDVRNVPKKTKGHLQDLIECIHFSGRLRSNMVPDRAFACLKFRFPNTQEKPLLQKCIIFCRKQNVQINIHRKKSFFKKSFCKGPYDIVLEAIGKSAHGSLPHKGRNAVCVLAMFLDQLALKKSSRSSVVRFIAKCVKEEHYGQALGIAKRHPKMGRLTVNLGHVTDEAKGMKLFLNIRYPKGIAPPVILKKIKNKLGFRAKISKGRNSMEPIWVSPKNPYIRKLKQAFRLATGLTPYTATMAGTTYAKVFKKAAGFGPLLPSETGTAHMPDEYIPIKTLLRNTKALAAAYLKLGCK